LQNVQAHTKPAAQKKTSIVKVIAPQQGLEKGKVTPNSNTCSGRRQGKGNNKLISRKRGELMATECKVVGGTGLL